MKRLSTLILSQKDILKISDIKKSIQAVERVFAQFARGKVQMPPKMYLDLKKYNGDFRAMPSYVEGIEACALKWVNVHPDNCKRGLATVMATIILSDPKTAYPLSIMDGTLITSLRTAAAGAVAAKYLARKGSSTVALIGCGVQAKSQLEALNVLFKLKSVKAWSTSLNETRMFSKKLKGMIHVEPVNSAKECVRDVDIIVTTTPSRKPLIKLAWVKRGVHINAIGADAPGKQELDPFILKAGKIVVDDWVQASHSGEINVALRKKMITKRNIYAGIGDIVLKRKKGRVNNREITIFDSTGLAVQDAAVAQMIYKQALKKRIGHKISLI